ncbi:hypothetical protein EQG69_11385 [Levilactobacillus brevis]|uniref:DUF5776 domain-containing protein n=1 Tax=Levilactobacillus brevis TaxID=1580 RepID=UPI000FF45C79|nr:DUF5776 domain-containing protein [Levilactobacillus brevis]RWZ42254.1 hypothetical protein EQG69_11385 [Levilactobacillus brevis]
MLILSLTMLLLFPMTAGADSTHAGIPTNTTLTDQEFEQQITADVDPDRPIREVFPDPVIASHFIDSYNHYVHSPTGQQVTLDSNYQAAMAQAGNALLYMNIPEKVHDWTGVKLIARNIAIISNQGDGFDKKALIYYQAFETGNSINFSNCGITQSTFDGFLDYMREHHITGIQGNFEYNHISDFSRLSNIVVNDNNYPEGYGFYGFFGAGQTKGHITYDGPGAPIKVAGNTATVAVDDFQQMMTLGSPTSTIPVDWQDSDNPVNHTYWAMDSDLARQMYDPISYGTALKKEELNHTFPGESPDLSEAESMSSWHQSDFDRFARNYMAYAGHYLVTNTGWRKVNVPPSVASSKMYLRSLADRVHFKLPDMVKNYPDRLTLTNIGSDQQSITIKGDYRNGGSIVTAFNTAVDVPLVHESSPAVSSTETSRPVTPSEPDNVTKPSYVVRKGQAVSGIQKLGLYRQATFTAKNRRVFYPRQSRERRPQFVVTGYATSKGGRPRYRVRDVNHHSRTAGLTGYITTQPQYVTNTYYKQNPRRIRVINAQGVNAYRRIKLTGKMRHYKRGAVLKVKRLESYHLTTRLVLTNGQYVTANKTLVMKR